MIGFFGDLKTTFQQENVAMSKEAFERLFSGLKGIMLLDTLDEAKEDLGDISKLGMGLKVVETRKIGLEKLKRVVLESLNKCLAK